MQIDFYITQVDSDIASYSLAAKLAAKAYQNKRHITILTDNQQQAQLLDDVLWTFNDISFIPHGIDCDDNIAVNITYAQSKPTKTDILLNLANSVPQWHTDFQRVMEIVHNGNKSQRRERFKFYKDRQYQVESHNV